MSSNSTSSLLSTSLTAAPAPAAHAGAAAPLANPLGDPGAADFVGQLKSALKNITRSVALPHLLPKVVPAQPAAVEPLQDVTAKTDQKSAADTAASLPDVLAALGFVLVPVPFTPPPPPVPPEKNGQAARQSSAAVVPGVAGVANAIVEAAPLRVPTPADLATLAEAQPQAPATALAQAPAKAAHADPATRSIPAAAPTSATPADPATAVAAQPVGTPLPPATGPQPTPQAITPEPAIGFVGGQAHGRPGGNADRRPDDGQPNRGGELGAIDASGSATPLTSATDAAMAANAATVAPPGAAALPQVQPAQVVAQIAHQADLYRLPGNRGVRIQLHPDGLGGVEVTMRYGAGGALQLHISVEHAATGSLVQAGWNQLRDALVTHGITPDRLVMSVTGPNSSSQLDFSGGGSSGRQPEPGLGAFTQSDSGQARHETPDQPAARGWNGALEPQTSSDDGARVASTTSATSRIDYRA